MTLARLDQAPSGLSTEDGSLELKTQCSSYDKPLEAPPF